MNANCLYCKSLCDDGAVKCRNCGAPVTAEEEATIDVRACPYCRRKLLALASPACNFCGLRLPAHFIKTREEQLRRITKVNHSGNQQEIKGKIDEVLRLAGKHDKGKDVSLLELVDWTDLTNLFS
jgi:DNA-directed RNA polymerase subunit RPC12/RpoP